MIIAVRDSFGSDLVSMLILVVALASILGLLHYLSAALSLEGFFLTAKQVDPRSSEAVAYIVTYLIPFLSLDTIGLRQAASLILLVVVIGVLYVRSSLIHVNPILNILGYHIFEILSADGKVNALITKRGYVAPGEQVRVASIKVDPIIKTARGLN